MHTYLPTGSIEVDFESQDDSQKDVMTMRY